MESFMRAKFVFLALFACALSASAPAPSDALASQQNLMLQRSTEISAATKRKPKKPVPQGTPYVRRGFADPSFGPDGKPYKVPEYLRGQCYIDDGYGRFSACNNRI
jgi:hypothetical protein